MATIKLEVVSPDKVVYENDIAMLIVRSTAGELGILPRHAPLVTGLIPHAMRIKLPNSATEQLLAVAGGFMEVTPEKIAVLASAAEEPEAIDILRAKKSMERAKERIAQFHQGPPDAKNDIDINRAQLALQRAVARLKASGNDIDA